MAIARRIPAALVVAVVATLASCGGGGTEPVRSPTLVVVSPATLSLVAGESRTVSAEPRDASGVVTGQSVAWSSSDPAVATVAGGTISAKEPGTATITASIGTLQGTLALTVTAIPVATVSVAPAQKTLLVTQATQLAATPTSAAGAALTGRTVTWMSSDEAIATVSATGLVTTTAVGAATITATSEGKSGTAAITVNPVPVASVRITPVTAEIFMGEQGQFDVATLDSIGGVLTGRTVTWTSSDGTIATVFASSPTLGIVTASKVGTATITATSEGKSATLAVTVLFGPRLRLTVSGLPFGYQAPIRLKSDDAGFLADINVQQDVPANFNRLAPGTYTLTAKQVDIIVSGTNFIYLPAESQIVHTFSITTSTTTAIDLVWTLRSGALAVTTSGLPAGGSITCNYQFDPPGLGGVVAAAFSAPTAQTTTVAVHGAGAAALSCFPTMIGGVTYDPTVGSQALNVPASTTPLPVTITYAPH